VPQELSTWQEVALVASPALAAIAAGASWVSVLQTRRLRREDDQPGLQLQLMSFPDGTIGAAVSNAGPAAARGVQVYLTHGAFFAVGSIGHGFLFPGETRIVRTPIPIIDPDAQTYGVISCRDKHSIPHAWNSHEIHRSSKTWRGKPRYRTLRAIFEDFYPSIEVESLQRANIQVTNESDQPPPVSAASLQ
jgi:hypothetical protein